MRVFKPQHSVSDSTVPYFKMGQVYSYDFVIVGGGTSGLALASRLTENPSVQVLVLEAGDDQTENPIVQIPSFYTACLGSPLDWNFTTQPQTGLLGRQVPLNQGKALGGSSAINAQVFVPPSAAIINAWEELGNDGWSWDVMASYFEKVHSEPTISQENKESLGINWKEGKTGKIQTSYPEPSADPVPTTWIETFKNIGRQMTPNPFSGTQDSGAFIPLASVDPASATRSYSATTYYAQAKSRSNLHVLTNSRVKKIKFVGVAPYLRATGVQYTSSDGSTVEVTASREVILAAGALQSPKILELSGIGGSELLKSLDIPVLINNPNVGENLQDHLISGVGFEAKDGVPTKDDLVRNDPAALGAAMQEYATSQSGPLSSVGLNSYAYLPVMDFVSESGQEQLQELLDQYAPATTESTLSKGYYEIARKILSDPEEASAIFLAVNAQGATPTVPPSGPQEGNYITLGAVLTEPFSRGSVHITANCPDVAPAINPNYLSHPMDLEVFGRHMLYLMTLAKQEPLKSTLLKDGGRLRDPGSNFTTLEEAKAYAKTSSISMWHPTSTCSMLPKKMGGVVDKKLLVYETTNLRIVDASIFPLVTRGNTQATVYAVAERAADIIKKAYYL
ncbi:hypothetical protein HYFRA_00003972 [Hymenoscyphus fraxineus]|uniref:Glucose-methanol-choline oxidoreductase N-terminal domain-containing protein n=1 Tax=Hymenoscyphus fraxineus TaxID=746836 RepID=A0A9N9L1J4_9HELO|nr:hypothetical protein HYFRA_00003972 [Hymenoscyphus fraxineus]